MGHCTNPKISSNLVTTLYVEKDLAGVCKAVWDLWDTRKDELNHKHLLAAGARETPGDIANVLAKCG
jgi:hypothetical protein